MSLLDDQPTVDERQGRQWLLDRYDGWALPPGAAAVVHGIDKWGDRPWERKASPRRHYDDQVAKHR